MKCVLFFTFMAAIALLHSGPRVAASMSTLANSSNSDVVRSTFGRLRSSRDKLMLLDGGTGEELFRRGVPDDRETWSAVACVHSQYHSILKEVHQSFVEAGSRAITTNSYGIVPGVGFSPAQVAEHVATSGRIARESVHGATVVVVLGSLGPLVESYRPDKILPHSEGVDCYKVMVEALAPYVDCFLAETMSCYSESTQAVQAAAGHAGNFPILVSYTLASQGYLRDGETPVKCIRKLLEFAATQKIELMGVLFNCAEPEAISLALQRIKSDALLSKELKTRGILLGAYANRLTHVASDWSMAESDAPQPMREDLEPERYYKEFVSKWIDDYDVQLIGGCCGITPQHISYLQSQLFE